MTLMHSHFVILLQMFKNIVLRVRIDYLRIIAPTMIVVVSICYGMQERSQFNKTRDESNRRTWRTFHAFFCRESSTMLLHCYVDCRERGVCIKKTSFYSFAAGGRMAAALAVASAISSSLFVFLNCIQILLLLLLAS